VRRFVKPGVDIISDVTAQRPRTRQPEIRPDQILDAAEGILLDRGAQAMTMDAVAEAAGLGKGTIYHHYGSKAELLSGLRARYLGRTVAHAETTARQGRTRAALARVDRFLEAILQSTADNHELLWILFHQTAIEEENELEGIYEALLALVCEGIQSGELVMADAEFTTGFLLHGFHGMTETAFHRGNVNVGRLAKSMRNVTRSLLTGQSSSAP
jgi:AcrR family transcriptional regulator